MTRTTSRTRAVLLTATLAGALLSLPQVSLAAGRASAATAQAQAGSPVANDAAARLNKARFKDIKVSVDNGIATLTGTVDLYEYKADAERRVHKAKGIAAVRNLIEVGGPTLPDKELQEKLAEKLAYDRVGYGNAFNAIGVRVENGVVTLNGHARTYVDRDSAMALVSTYPGVKDVVEEIEVDPVSIMDDQTRIAGRSRNLRLSVAEQVLHRPGEAYPHLRAERPRRVVWHSRFAGRQGSGLYARQRRSRRLQREEFTPGCRPALGKAEVEPATSRL